MGQGQAFLYILLLLEKHGSMGQDRKNKTSLEQAKRQEKQWNRGKPYALFNQFFYTYTYPQDWDFLPTLLLLKHASLYSLHSSSSYPTPTPFFCFLFAILYSLFFLLFCSVVFPIGLAWFWDTPYCIYVLLLF